MRFRISDRPDPPDDNNAENSDLRPETAVDPAAALAEAEAEAAAAEATAAAARNRAEEIRLRRESVAEDGANEPTPAEAATAADDETTVGAQDVDASAVEDDHDAVETASESTPPGLPAPEKRRVGASLRWAAAGLTVLLIGALVTVSVLMVIQHRGVEADQRLAGEYAAAAKQSVVTLMSLDFNSVDEDVKRIIENSTGDFREEFESQAEDFATVAKESKVVTEATATAAAVESMTDDEAVVLVTATSTVTNTSGADQDPRSWRLTVNLIRDGDQIKMSKVEFAP